jgi:drug/metabolite transporter (DMT)-like permease
VSELLNAGIETETRKSGEGSSNLSGLGKKALEQPIVLLFVVGGFLAVSTIFAKAAPGLGWHPLALLQWSVLGGALGLFVVTRTIFRNKDKDKSPEKGYRKRLVIYLSVSGLLFIAPNMIAVVAAPKVGAGFVSLSFAFPLVLTYAFAVLLRLERFQFMRGSGVLFGLVGGVLLALSGAELSEEASRWSLFALSIPAFLAIGNIYRTIRWPVGAKPIDLALGMMATGFLALAVFTTILEIPVLPASWTAGAMGLLAGQTLIFTVQYGLYFRLQQTAGPVYLSQIGSVAAVVGLGLGFLVFDEIPNLAKLAAAASVGAGVVLVTLGRRRG